MIQTTLDAYLADQSNENLAAFHRALLDTPGFERYADANKITQTPGEAGDWEGVITAILDHMPSLLLSPMAHHMLATAYAELGKTEEAEREKMMVDLAFHMIFSSGDGTQESPFHVLRISDEYDALAVRKLTCTEQRAHQGEGGAIVDELVTDNGTSLWFQLAS